MFARRLARNVLLRSMTRSRLARDGRARVRSAAEVVPLARVSRRRSRWIRVSRAIGDERRASADANEDDEGEDEDDARASVVDDGASRETRIHRTMMMDEGAGKP